MKKLTKDLIEALDLALRQGEITKKAAYKLCDLIDETKSEDELNRIILVKGVESKTEK